MFKKMVVTLVIMISCVSGYAMDNIQNIRGYYRASAQSDLAMAMRFEIQRLYEQGRVEEAQWLAEQQLLWYQSNSSPLTGEVTKKKR